MATTAEIEKVLKERFTPMKMRTDVVDEMCRLAKTLKGTPLVLSEQTISFRFPTQEHATAFINQSHRKCTLGENITVTVHA